MALLAGIAVLALAPPSASAPRRPPLEPLGQVDPRTRLAHRFLVAQPQPAALRVQDLVARTTTEVALPEACALKDARHALSLVSCERPSPWWPYRCWVPHLAFLGTGELREIRARRANGTWEDCQPGIEYDSVGLHWVVGQSRDQGPTRPSSGTYLNWRTGDYGRPPPGGDGYEPGPRGDVDDPDLGAEPEYPWLTEGRHRIPYPDTPKSPLRLRTAGRPERVLSRCRIGCHHVWLAGERVVWKEGRRTLHAYAIRSEARWRWRLPTVTWRVVTTAAATLVVAHRDGRDFGYFIRWR